MGRASRVPHEATRRWPLRKRYYALKEKKWRRESGTIGVKILDQQGTNAVKESEFKRARSELEGWGGTRNGRTANLKEKRRKTHGECF